MSAPLSIHPDNSGNETIIMTLLVRDEEDIIAENIEFHRAQGVDHFIITDNLSTDFTLDILQKYVDLGWVTLWHETDDDYNQSRWVTKMARAACAPPFNADWVINNDADEFWVASNGDLKSFFASQSAETNTINAQRHDFAFLYGNDQIWHESMVYRKRHSLNHIGIPLPPKVAHRAHPDIVVAQGNHAVSGITPLVTGTQELDILHFPVRSQRQFEQKIQNGGAAYSRNTNLPKTMGKGWRNLYSTLKQNGSLDEYLHLYGIENEKVADEIQNGNLILDRRIAEFVLNIK